MINLCRLAKSKDRALYIIKCLRQKPETKSVADSLNYDDYLNALNKTKVTVDDKNYFILNTSFIIDTSLHSYKTLTEIYKQNSSINLMTQI
jgi:hypothetical protein